MDADPPAVVLGSTQPEGHIDLEEARRQGIEVARRRSGGGAVLVERGHLLWIDLVIPAGDDLWDVDVTKAAAWVGELWAETLMAVKADGDVSVWKDRLRRTEWSERVCFAGVGPGEVLLDGRKVVGVSQRRTRGAALFQTAALLEWRPGDLTRLLALDPADRDRADRDLRSAATGIRRSAEQLLEAFSAALPR